jgi:hypothetical protein
MYPQLVAVYPSGFWLVLRYWEQPENTFALHVRAVGVCPNVWSKRVHSIGVYTNWPFFQIGPADQEKIS